MKGRELLELVGRLAGLSRRRAAQGRVGDARADRPRRRRQPADRDVLRRDAPATRHRPGRAPRARAADPRRAGQLARPGGPARPARADREPRGSATVIVSTHVLADVERICDRVAILDRGRLVTEGPLAELLAAHARPIFRLVPALGQGDGIAALADRLRAAPWARTWRSRAGAIRVDVTGRGRGLARDPAARRRRGRCPDLVRAGPADARGCLPRAGRSGVAGRARRARLLRPREVDRT